MEFCMIGFDGMLSSGHGFSSVSSDHEVKQKWCGSDGVLKKQRSGFSNDDFKASKICKLNDDLSPSKTLPFNSSTFVSSDGSQEQNMLSFSSSKPESFSLNSSVELGNRNLQSSAFPYFQCSNLSYSKNAGYSCTGGGVNASMYFLNGYKGPFTASQWLELEQQALIYKYIIANEPIPTNLLIPIGRALESAGFCSFPGGLVRPNTFGWGPFLLGSSNSTDPEPGRCCRTDGKKWRCSRDAVSDQKYCVRHINRGRHRSRKPVEGHSGHSASGATTSKTTSTINPRIMASSSSSALVVPGGGASNRFAITHNHIKDLHTVASDHLASPLVNRLTANKANNIQGMQDGTGLSFTTPSISLNSSGDTFSISKEPISYAQTASGGFVGLTSDALLNTTQTSSSLFRTYSSHDLNAQESGPQHSLRPFIDEWPKNPADRSILSWPKIQTESDRANLSISIPVAPSDFMSSTSSPTGKEVNPSPLRLSRELDSVQMGLGVGAVPDEQSHKQANWVPISWETSMGGPLGEVLKTISSSSGHHIKSGPSALNLLSNGWEGSPRLASSPTGVLQRTALGSLSNISAGSSPRAENGKVLERGSLCDNLTGSTLGYLSAVSNLWVLGTK